MTTSSSVALRIAPDNAPSAMDAARQQFQEQIDFFRVKLNLPTERWDDIQSAAHDKAFIVAGAQKADLLADLRAAVDKSIAGQSIGDFRKQFAAAVAKSGWTGWTGEGTTAGVAWRTRVIYQTNIATSYAAGRWAQLNDPELLAVRPYWRYIHSDSVINPRKQHKAWGDAGLTLRHDHPFWLSHFPPNGWGCHCYVQAVRGPKAGDRTEPPAGWDTVDPKTDAPPGIDKGWAYAPGATWHPNLDKYPFELAREVVSDNLKDGVFEHWHKKIADRVETELADSVYVGLSQAEKITLLRKRLSVKEQYPVAVLSPEAVKSMGIKTQTVFISDYDLIKQQVSRDGQDLSALDYLKAQVTLDSPRLIVRENDQMTLFVSDFAGQWYAAVLQQTSTGKGLYLKSFRRSSQRDAQLQRKKGQVLLDALPAK